MSKLGRPPLVPGERVSEWRKLHPKKYKKLKRKCHVNRRERWKAWMAELKDAPCMDCNVKFPPVVMDFDHVRGIKKFNIATEGRGITRALVKKEIKKCDLVCSNCHRIRTEKRRKGGS